MRPEPYIGVTGFSTRTEVEHMLAARPHGCNLLMVGVLVSSKTLAGEQPDQPKRYPPREKLSQICTSEPGLLNFLHLNVSDPGSLGEEMLKAHEFAGEHCHGFQINKTWPDMGAIEKYKKKYPASKVVLQCGVKAIESVEHSPEKLSARVREYGPLVDYVIVDTSGGQGIPFNPFSTENFFSALDAIPDLGLVVAGGLSAGTLVRLTRLWKHFSGFSIDAESKLRTNDTLDLTKVSAYISIANATFAQHRRAA